MRRAALLALAFAALGCAPAPSLVEVCGYPVLDRPVLVLERGEPTASLARLEGGCLAEAPAELPLGADQNLLAAHGRPFVGVNDNGALFGVDVAGLALKRPALDAYADGATSWTAHGIYGVDVDAANNLWVSRDDVSSLVILRPDGKVEDTVDLSALDTKYGNPRMNGVLVQGPYAYVALGFLPTPVTDEADRNGGIAEIATAAPHDVTRVIDLVGHNPVHALVPTGDPGVVLVATPGRHDELSDDDGIDRVWLDGSRPTEQLAREKELGGSVEEVAWGGEHEVYAITLGEEPGLNPTRLVVFDPSQPAGPSRIHELAKAPWFDDPVNGAAYVHSGLALTRDHVLVGDHTPGAPKIRVFSRATGKQVAAIPTTVGAPWSLLALAP